MESDQVCFVIMPIGVEDSETRQRANEVFQNVIAPVVKRMGYAPLRADKMAKPGIITTDIIQQLIDAPLVIADLSNYNPNVFYELAVRHAAKKPVIQIIAENQPLPFDIAQMRTIYYDHTSVESVRNCEEEMIRQIDSIKTGTASEFYNPVSMAIDIQQLRRSHSPEEQAYAELIEGFNRLASQISHMTSMLPSQRIIDDYRAEIETLASLRDAGITNTFRRRDVALNEFESAIDEETTEIMIIGSSLMGLLQKEQYKEFTEKLRLKMQQTDVNVKFLLTHPAVADLRADVEAHRFKEIGVEIIKSLRILHNWNVRAENVRLYKGAPTIFAIKTKRKMLINPYAYGVEAFNSPCLIVKNDPERYCYFYDEYNRAHFGAWESNTAEIIENFETKIAELESKLEHYAGNIKTILEE
jgi:hypothetical protein